jgi:hypothetical protein
LVESVELLHARSLLDGRAAWYQVGDHAADLAEAGAAWERSIAYARAAREEAGLGHEFGVVTDRDYVLGTPLWVYADILIENGEFKRAAC